MSKKAWWLVLFVGDPPTFGGGAIVRATGGIAAVEKVGRLNLQPKGMAMYPAGEVAITVKPQDTDRHLTEAELDTLRRPVIEPPDPMD